MAKEVKRLFAEQKRSVADRDFFVLYKAFKAIMAKKHAKRLESSAKTVINSLIG